MQEVRFSKSLDYAINEWLFNRYLISHGYFKLMNSHTL